MPALAKALRATTGAAMEVKGRVFDRVCSVLTNDQGKITFVDGPQRLLAGDMEK